MDKATLLERHQLRYARRGLLYGMLSGIMWGFQGPVLYVLAMASGWFLDPYRNSFWVGCLICLVFTCAHEMFASLWVLLLNGMTGRLKEIGRALRTRPGRLAIVSAVFGGPIGSCGYILGMYLAGGTYAMVISAIYPAVGALLGRIFLKERINARVWAGIFCCLIGAVVVNFGGFEEAALSKTFILGIIFSALPVIGWGAGGTISNFGMDMVDPDIVLWIRETASFVLEFVVVLLGGSILIAHLSGGSETYLMMDGVTEAVFRLDWSAGWRLFGRFLTEGRAVFWAAVAAAFGGFSYVLFYRAMNMIGSSRGMAFNVTYAMWGIPGYYLCGLLAKSLCHYDYGYSITPVMLAGAVVITVGAILVSVNPRELAHLRDGGSGR